MTTHAPLTRSGEYTKQGRAVLAAAYECDGLRYHAEVWTYHARSGDYMLMFPLFTRTMPAASRQEVLVEPLPGALLLDLAGPCPAAASTARMAVYRLKAIRHTGPEPLFELEPEGNTPHSALAVVRWDLIAPADAFVDAPIALRRLERVSAVGPTHPYWRPRAGQSQRTEEGSGTP